MKRGPVAKSAEERAMTGVRLRRGAGTGETPENRPMRPSGELVAPAYLSPAALPYWNEVTGWVSQMGLAWPCDVIVLAQIAELTAIMVELNKMTWGQGVKKVWALQKDSKGNVLGIHLGAHAKELREIRKELNSLLEQVGLTPAARTRLRVIPPPAQATHEADASVNVPKTAAGNYDFAAAVSRGAALRGPLPLPKAARKSSQPA